MTKEIFKQHLEGISKETLSFVRENCWNQISENVCFVIQPNSIELSEHLNEMELENLDSRIRELNKKLSYSEVADRLVVNEHVPVWINTSVHKASKNKTIIKLITSRRFRKNLEDLYHTHDIFPPFHIALPLPPNKKNHTTFNVNWQHQKWKSKLIPWHSNWR